jgi:hypothetical protein
VVVRSAAGSAEPVFVVVIVAGIGDVVAGVVVVVERIFKSFVVVVGRKLFLSGRFSRLLLRRRDPRRILVLPLPSAASDGALSSRRRLILCALSTMA